MFNKLVDNPGARRKKKCLGRGIGSGKGKTCGKGHKGQKARSGISLLGFEGGQMPLYIRMPKRGFTNYTRIHYTEVNFDQLSNLVEQHGVDPSDINVPELAKKGLIKGKYNLFKLLNKGKMTKPLKITVHAATNGAIEVLKKAKGEINLLNKAAT